MRTHSWSLALLLIIVASPISAQQNPGRVAEGIIRSAAATGRIETVSLLSLEPAQPELAYLWSGACSQAEVLRFDRAAANQIIDHPKERVRLHVPSASGGLWLDLKRCEPLDRDLLIRTSDGTTGVVEQALHFRGMIIGSPRSVVSVSVFRTGMMALLSDDNGERIIGDFDQAPEDLLVSYHEGSLRGAHTSACGVSDPGPVDAPKETQQAGGAKTIRCVKWYWEVANDIYVNKGSNLTTTTNYITGLFNQVATLYDNDGIDIQLQEVFVWTTASPYNATSSGGRLSQFGTTRTSFNGDFAHLLDLGGYGGVAWLNTYCAGTSSRMAYSGINASYSNVPTYSWSVEVTAHEQGHSMGSPHTHACSWNGNGTAIDGCGPAAGYPTEGGCATPPVPSSAVGGTIMSYCHLVSAGINFNNGFGPQPGALIAARTNQATCLAVCGSTCDAPTLGLTGLTPNNATLQWANVGAATYDLRWKAQASPTWTNVNGLTTNTYALSGLTQATAYEFQVRSNCTGGAVSAYSTSYTFTTPVPCPDALEPNNSVAAAANITLPANISALIATNTDQDFYRFTLASAGTVNLSLSGLPFDYDLYLLSNAGTQLAASENGGTSSEFISFGASAGTYVIKVNGWNGAFSTLLCYALNASVSAPACGPINDLTTTGITYNSANLNWTAVLSASSYDVDWKLSSSSTWTTVPAVTGSTYALSGLTWNTSYDWRVKPTCAGSQSNYGEPATFTTTNAPCEVAPPVLVAAKVFLEGPFNAGNSTMNDGLRAAGFLPTTEPYSALGLAVTGATTCAPSVFTVTGQNAIVDWVVVELRSSANPATVVERRAGLLQADGDVVDVNGTSALGFCSAAGDYHVAVRHRNHAGCMTSSAIALNNIATTVNLTSAATGTYGTEARKTSGALMLLWAGRTNADVNIQYTGAGNDRDPILLAVGSTTPNNTVTGYLLTDVNMDGSAQYTGAGNDRDPILINVGSTTPNNIRVQQLP